MFQTLFPFENFIFFTNVSEHFLIFCHFSGLVRTTFHFIGRKNVKSWIYIHFFHLFQNIQSTFLFFLLQKNTRLIISRCTFEEGEGFYHLWFGRHTSIIQANFQSPTWFIEDFGEWGAGAAGCCYVHPEEEGWMLCNLFSSLTFNKFQTFSSIIKDFIKTFWGVKRGFC